MKINTLVLGGLLCLLFALPAGVQAYFTTSQTAVPYGNDKILFTVSYKFGFLNRDLYMPVMAIRGLDTADKSGNLGYGVVTDGVIDVKIGRTTALVLSSAEIKDGRYYLPRGKNGTFTLVAVMDNKPAQNTKDISLLVTSLPFTMVEKGKNYEARLNPSELQYYVTPKVK